ncbi:hypothetical protein LOK49_LG04G02825 [Camellia lanceoleosa]|uniref:Uncharacterized protein n=1 Tax=Camellia lanceoleosa TaxID=1840588 RepID=A0ACC0HXG8_9ERIC|nr:hypothetical protein LOK49_LG04G02825 [Camellia lanceoleosa]
MVFWFIWKDRNNYVFNHHPVEPSSTLHRVRVAIAEFENVVHRPAASVPHGPSLIPEDAGTWTPPDQGRFKVNWDVATKKDSSQASIAVVLRNAAGRIMNGLTKKEYISSSFQGEALACRWACLFAKACGLPGATIEGDNKSVILLSVSETVPPWECGLIIEDIRRLASQEGLILQWRPRSANSVAHWVAQKSLHGYLPQDWVSNPPAGLAALLGVS